MLLIGVTPLPAQGLHDLAFAQLQLARGQHEMIEMRFELLDDVYWTLAVELGFYVAMGVVWSVGVIDKIERVLWIWLPLSALASR